MSRPRVTFCRNGSTSSGPSGPPKDTISRASYGSGAGDRHQLAGAVNADVALGPVAQHRDHRVLHDLVATGRAGGALTGLDAGVTRHELERPAGPGDRPASAGPGPPPPATAS